MAFLLREKWVWIIIAMLIAVILVPFMIVLVILNLPSFLVPVAIVALVLCWALTSAYKEWTKDKREQEEKMKVPQ